MLVTLTYSEAYNNIIIEPRPQIGFKKSDDTYDYFDLQNLPSKDILKKQYQLPHAKSIFVYPDILIDEARIAHRHSIIAQVSLFNCLRYTISLARCYHGEKPQIDFGHFFDISAKNILPICKSSLIIPKIKLLLPGRDF